MYSRQVNGAAHTFGVSGKLIMNALVMYDHQTRTLWSQFLSKGVEGELAGVELDMLPATQTTWAAWLELHPDTKVLDKGGGGRIADPYALYYEDGRAGVLGETNPDDRLPAKALVMGVSIDGASKAYALDALSGVNALNDTFADQEVLAFYDDATATALIFDRNVNGTPLTFSAQGVPNGVQTILVDDQTGSRWSAFSGRALDGELQGATLKRISSHLSFWFAWSDWHPQTQLYAE